MKRLRRLRQGQSIALTLAFLLLPLTASANDSLGISVTVVPYANEEGLSSGNDELWFPVEPGGVIERQIRVKSFSDQPQLVQVLPYDYGTSDGERFTNFGEPSVVTEFLEVTPNEILLAPNQTELVTIRFAIPDGAPERAYEGVFRVLGEFASPQEAEEGSGARAVLPGNVAIDVEFWLGIGAALDLLPKFDITGIEGILEDNEQFLRVYFENTGLTPIQLRGSVQFADPVFVDRVFDPVTFVSPEIFSSESGFTDVPVSDEITEGPWRVLVAAEQDGIRQTRLFEQNISFLAPSERIAWIPLAIQILLVLVFLALAILAIRLLRSGGKGDSSSGAVKPSTPKPPKKKASEQKQTEPVLVKLGLLLDSLKNRLRSVKIDLSFAARISEVIGNRFKMLIGFISSSVSDLIYFITSHLEKRKERAKAKELENRIEEVLKLKQRVKELETEDIRFEVMRREFDRNYQLNYPTTNHSKETAEKSKAKVKG